VTSNEAAKRGFQDLCCTGCMFGCRGMSARCHDVADAVSQSHHGGQDCASMRTAISEQYSATGFAHDYAGSAVLRKADNESDVAWFVSSASRDSDVSRTKRIDALPSADMPWCDPGSPSKFISMVFVPDYVPAVRVLISLDDGRRAVMYIYQTH